jgi:hypothetical protein
MGSASRVSIRSRIVDDEIDDVLSPWAFDEVRRERAGLMPWAWPEVRAEWRQRKRNSAPLDPTALPVFFEGDVVDWDQGDGKRPLRTKIVMIWRGRALITFDRGKRTCWVPLKSLTFVRAAKRQSRLPWELRRGIRPRIGEW